MRGFATGLGLVVLLASGSLGADETPRPIEEDFRVELPEAPRTIPEPLPEGKAPGFPLRGTKGWLWRAEQYLAEVPVLAEYQLNFLMICYGSMCDLEHYAWGHPDCNRWWEPLADAKRAAYQGVLRACQEHGIELCLSMNPNLTSKRIIDYDSEADLDALWQHYAWMQGLGMKWFCISLDDIRKGIDAAGQARLVSAMFERLRANDPEAQLIFCPTRYWGDGTGADSRAYLETLAREMDAEVYLFWTGDAVVTPRITRAAAASYKEIAQHRLIIWDNYPVNDAHPTLHLGPLTGRAPDLCEVCDGYMSNPLHSENEINRIPLLTCADYAYNPWAYDPARAIGQAIVHVAETHAQRAVLKDLVELYPGMLVYAKDTAWNPVVSRFREFLATPHSRHVAALYLGHVQGVLARLEAASPGRFDGAKATVRQNLIEMDQAYSAQYGEWMLRVGCTSGSEATTEGEP